MLLPTDPTCAANRVGAHPPGFSVQPSWYEDSAMDVLAKLKAHDFGEVHFKFDKSTQLHAIVAIHDSRMGPALGGCRFIEYDNEEAALTDALRLARGMTYKAALAGLAHGGGKAVILLPKE